MVLVSCGILCGRLVSLTKTLQSLQSIVSQTLIHTEMIYFSATVWRIVFDRYYSTLCWHYFVFCKDRPRWRQRVFDLLPSNLLSAGYFVAFSLNITLRPSLSHRWITSLRWNWGKINVLYNTIFGVFVFHSEFCTLFIFLTLDVFMYDRAYRAYYTGCYTNLTDCGVNGCFTHDLLFTQPRCPSLSTQHLILH